MKASVDSVNIAVFASGRGSNFSALGQAIAKGQLAARCQVLICDQPKAGVLDKAKEARVPALVVEAKSKAEIPSAQERRQDHELRILEALKPYAPRFIVLAGYMRLIGKTLLQSFLSQSPSGSSYYRIVNIHPSLLPKYPGLDAYAQAFQAGEKTTGVTVHLLDEGMDTGPICAQEEIDISACQSVEEVERLGLETEHRLYTQALNWILKEDFEVIDEKGLQHVRPS